MKRVLKKATILLIVLVMLLIGCPILTMKSYATEEAKIEYENVADYLLKNENSTSTEWYHIRIANAIIKDFSDISNYTNLNHLYMENVNIGNVNGVEIPSGVREFTIFGGFNGTLDLTKNINLEYVIISEDEENAGGLANAVVDIRGLEKIYLFEFDYMGTTKYLISEKVLMDDYSIPHRQYDFTIDNVTTNVFQFRIYNNLTHYFEKELSWEYENITDVTELDFFWNGETIKDISDISKFSNLETLNIYGAALGEGTYSFSNNKKLKEIHINFYEQDLSNIVIDIRNMDWLNEFYIDSDFANNGFELDKNLLIDDRNILGGSTYEEGDFFYYFRVFETVDECLECYGENKEEITYYTVSGQGDIIKDISGLSELINLRTLNLKYMDLQNLSFIKELTNLVQLSIEDCTLNTTLDLKSNINLEDVWIELIGNLENAVIDIRGLSNLKHFNYGYYTDKASNFNLENCILKDSNLELTYTNDEESMYESYYYTNHPVNIDSNLNTSELEDGTSIIHGFVLNEEKTLTLGDIQTREYFAEGVTAKVFDESGTEITDITSIIGTGKVIKLYKDGELVEEHNIVIYGDTTGDGKINPVDALAIIKNKNQNLLLGNKILEEAGRVTEKSYSETRIPSAVDALAIIKYANGNYDIDQRDYYYGIGGLVPVG